MFSKYSVLGDVIKISKGIAKTEGENWGHAWNIDHYFQEGLVVYFEGKMSFMGFKLSFLKICFKGHKYVDIWSMIITKWQNYHSHKA